MTRFLRRVQNLFFHPQDEWLSIKEENTTYRNILLGYVAVLAAIPPVSSVVERVIINTGIVSNAVHSPLRYVLAANVAWYLVIIVNMIITAAIITALVIPRESGWMSITGLQLAGYSYTPLFLVGILIIIPRLSWLLYPAILHSVYLLYLGIRTVTDLDKRKAVLRAGASFFAAAIIVGTLNMLEYMFESFIAGKIFF